MMTAPKRTLIAMDAIGVAAILTSCQLPGGSEAKGEDMPAPASASASKSAQAGGGTHGVTTESYPTTVDGGPGTVSLDSASSVGTTITVMSSVTNNDRKNDMWIYGSFSDGDGSMPQLNGRASPGGSANNTNSLALAELSSSGIYRVSYDSQDDCLCSSNPTEYVKPGQTIALQVTFTGMSVKAKNVTITILNGETFNNVTVTR